MISFPTEIWCVFRVFEQFISLPYCPIISPVSWVWVCCTCRDRGGLFALFMRVKKQKKEESGSASISAHRQHLEDEWKWARTPHQVGNSLMLWQNENTRLPLFLKTCLFKPRVTIMNISDLVSIKSKPHFCNETILFNSARMFFGFADVRMRKHLLPLPVLVLWHVSKIWNTESGRLFQTYEVSN